jgi:hypothetical protein
VESWPGSSPVAAAIFIQFAAVSQRRFSYWTVHVDPDETHSRLDQSGPFVSCIQLGQVVLSLLLSSVWVVHCPLQTLHTHRHGAS